ncbi:DUF domain-containing protein, partial [Mycobacterium kansasii]
GTIYHKSIDASEATKNANYINELMDKVVDEIGEENIVQIVTDNEATYKLAGHMLMDKRKHLFWSKGSLH